MIEPGRYDDLCTYVREQAQARSVIVIVIDGTRGSGISSQGAPTDLAELPAILEYAAADIRKNAAQSAGESERP
jgi:hypothetical protein